MHWLYLLIKSIIFWHYKNITRDFTENGLNCITNLIVPLNNSALQPNLCLSLNYTKLDRKFNTNSKIWERGCMLQEIDFGSKCLFKIVSGQFSFYWDCDWLTLQVAIMDQNANLTEPAKLLLLVSLGSALFLFFLLFTFLLPQAFLDYFTCCVCACAAHVLWEWSVWGIWPLLKHICNYCPFINVESESCNEWFLVRLF